MRVAAILAALAVAGCSSAPSMDAQTPFGSFRVGDPAPPMPADACRFGGETVLPVGSTLECGVPPGDTAGAGTGRDPVQEDRTEVAADDTPGLREQLRAAEGGPLLTPKDGHVCHGHWITDEERADGRFDEPLTIEQCDALLDEDIAEARGEALRVFRRTDHGVVELCFWRPCARMFGGLAGEALAAAVESNADMLRRDAARTRNVARAIREVSP